MLRVKLRTPNTKDKNGNTIPVYIDYSSLTIDGEEILEDNQLVSFDEPFVYKMDVSNSQIIDFHVEWMPVNEGSIYLNQTVESLKDENESLKEKNRQLQNELNELKSKKIVKLIRKL